MGGETLEREGGGEGGCYLMKAGRRRSVVSGSPAVAQAAWRESAAAFRTRKTGSSARETSSGEINWWQRSGPEGGRKEGRKGGREVGREGEH